LFERSVELCCLFFLLRKKAPQKYENALEKKRLKKCACLERKKGTERKFFAFERVSFQTNENAESLEQSTE